jgi:hypothetical protein
MDGGHDIAYITVNLLARLTSLLATIGVSRRRLLILEPRLDIVANVLPS